ncbi:MAG: sigma-54 dependent transcriptional regulator [Planctomycetaceae bacterium]|jgi:DNA-binding NtrC family response regulator|nr:sigma-54 dependent transcriptional regulator [Planctomycetaceae bacterium]
MKSFFVEEELVGSSQLMQGVRKLIERVGGTDSAVVVLGETGTGKELVARSIHSCSQRREKPFVAVNCGALPEGLIESELFGHRKGSFTGADVNRVGLLEVADGGTLFLDEIGDLPKAMQAKLLRFLENGEIRRVGDNTTTFCNVRIICATLKNLESMVRDGEFREDLWFRINTFVIRLPALRERREDLPELIFHLVRRCRPELGVKLSDKGKTIADIFTERAFKRLQNYDWPGNIRQLANTIEHALVLSDKLPLDVDSLPETLDANLNNKKNTVQDITIQDRDADNRPEVCKDALDSNAALPALNQNQNQNQDQNKKQPETQLQPEAQPQNSLEILAANLTAFNPKIQEQTNQNNPPSLRELETQAIIAALQRNNGNKAKAAEELGISLKTLYNKLNLADIKF